MKIDEFKIDLKDLEETERWRNVLDILPGKTNDLRYMNAVHGNAVNAALGKIFVRDLFCKLDLIKDAAGMKNGRYVYENH